MILHLESGNGGQQSNGNSGNSPPSSTSSTTQSTTTQSPPTTQAPTANKPSNSNAKCQSEGFMADPDNCRYDTFFKFNFEFIFKNTLIFS